MTCKKFCIRRIGACIACLVLVINLVCTSYTRVQAAPVAGAYALEEVVAALLVSLGITSATGEALNKAGLTPENARTIINSVYASAKEFSHDTDEIINETIENAVLDAMETGKLIFKQGSQAWNALKAWAKSVGADIAGLLKPSTDAALSNYYDFSNIGGLARAAYFLSIVSAIYASHGIAWSYTADDVTKLSKQMYSVDKYYAIFYCENDTWAGHSIGVELLGYDMLERFLELPETCEKYYNNINSEYGASASQAHRFTFETGGEYVVRSGYSPILGQASDLQMLNPASARLYQKYGMPDLAMDNAYQTVYNPAIPDTTDVVTPSNTITREKDDSVAVAGDYVIDVALPVAFPVDLTKGIVIDRDIPIEDAIDRSKTDDKTDDKEDNKPVTPDIPSADIGADLTADLKSIFPFCIPFDLIACIKGLVAEGEPPKWVIKIPMPLDYTWTIVVDMADFDGVVKIFRAGEDILFIVGLIMITRSLMIRG